MLQEKKFIYLIVILTMMSMMGLLASDVYIPGLHGLTHSLNATDHKVQLTIGVYLFGLAFFQLIYGPLSDHFGRKPVLLFGFVVYTVSSMLCAMATEILALSIISIFGHELLKRLSRATLPLTQEPPHGR